jgi:hypothetical protein
MNIGYMRSKGVNSAYSASQTSLRRTHWIFSRMLGVQNDFRPDKGQRR